MQRVLYFAQIVDLLRQCRRCGCRVVRARVRRARSCEMAIVPAPAISRVITTMPSIATMNRRVIGSPWSADVKDL